MNKVRFTIEPFTFQVKSRSQVDCQENRGSRSDWEIEDRRGYKIMLGGKEVKKFAHESDAQNYMLRYLKISGIRQHYAQLKSELKKKIDDAKREEAKEIAELQAITR